MVSNSSSASLSSFHYFHSSSSSLSSPLSSPASSQDSFTAPTSCSPSSTLALVPFLWEEKPGVLKKAMQISGGDGNDRHEHSSCSVKGSPSSQGHLSFLCDAPARTHRADSFAISSKQMSRTFPATRSKTRSESVPHLRLPPRLSKPNQDEYGQGDGNGTYSQHHHHHPCGTSVGIESKVMPSFPFHKRRHHRGSSLEDDPFWMAMVACTNDDSKGGRMRFNKGNRDKEMRRADSWFARKVQGQSIHFEQCMPRHSGSNREKSGASSDHRNSSNKGARDAVHTYGEHDLRDTSMHSRHSASTAFKALNLAKSELHGQCKVILQQQKFPVDISCSTRRNSKKPSFASKFKLPDVFGLKSHHPLSNIPP